MKKQNKMHQNARFIDEKLKTKSFIFHVICKISNFNMWTAKHLAQVPCTELNLFSTQPYSNILPSYSIFQHTGKVSLTDYGGLVAIRGLCYHNKDRSRNFSGMKTFHKPDWYSTIRLSREREDILGKYFKTHSTHSKNELATLIGPMYAEIFLPALVSIICNILLLTISVYWFKGVIY